MAFDYKKEYKEFYLPPKRPTIVTVPPMNYIKRHKFLYIGHLSKQVS